MPIYYPSALVGLLVRLEKPVPKGMAPEDAAAEPTYSPKPVLPGKRMAEMVQVDETDPYAFVIGVQPRDVEWTEKAAREANDARVTLAWSDLPLDPRTVRSCVVQVFAGQVDASSWQQGATARNGEIVGRSVVTPTEGNLRFIGHVDEMALTSGENGAELSLRCRDFTALLLDKEIPGETLKKLNLSQPLLPAVQQVLASLPATASMPVVPDPDILAECMLAKLSAGDQRQVLGTTGASKQGSPEQSSAKVTYWDLITGLCLTAGFVPIVELYRLRIRRPLTLYTESAALAPKMVWGGNLSDLKITRKWARSALQPIEVRCADWHGKGIIVSRYPADARAEASPAGKGSTVTYRLKVVHGKAKAQCDAIAQAVYLESAQGQCEVEMTTQDMLSFPSPGESPVDLLTLHAGAPVLVVMKDVRTGQTTALFRPETVDEMQGKSPAAIAVDLQRRGVKPSVATVLATALAQGKHINAFRVQQITHKISSDDGYSCAIKCGTYLEIDPAKAGGL